MQEGGGIIGKLGRRKKDKRRSMVERKLLEKNGDVMEQMDEDHER